MATALDLILDTLRTVRPEVDFAASQDYFADGLLDSFDLVLLVSALEERAHLNIAGTDILPQNFRSAANILELLQRHGYRGVEGGA